MNYLIHFKISKKIIQDHEFVINLVKQNTNREKRRLLSKESKVFTPIETKFYEQDADNFRYDLVTVAIWGNAYKVPRILKKLYLN